MGEKLYRKKNSKKVISQKEKKLAVKGKTKNVAGNNKDLKNKNR